MRVLIKFVLFLVILGLGAGGYWYLYETRDIPGRQRADERATLVTVVAAEAASGSMVLSGMGTVMPAQTVTLFPEVAGRIVYQSPNLVPGGRFGAGDTVLRIDPVDYDLAIRQQNARVVQARMELARERGLKSVAEREWSLIRDEVKPTTEGRKLALREIQLENAKAALDAAESTLELATRLRERCVIRAPFNAVVSEEFVDRGQVLFNSSRIATLVASDTFWVQVSVPVERLNWIQIPEINGQTGSPAQIIQTGGDGRRVTRPGRVVRLETSLDPQGKMARLLVEVDNPLGAPDEDGTIMPLLLGDYVEVAILGRQTDGALALPRRAIREQGRIYVMTPAGRLDMRTVQMVWAQEDLVYVRGDLKPGEAVVTSRIYAPVQDMKLHTGDQRPPVAGGPQDAS